MVDVSREGEVDGSCGEKTLLQSVLITPPSLQCSQHARRIAIVSVSTLDALNGNDEETTGRSALLVASHCHTDSDISGP